MALKLNTKIFSQINDTPQKSVLTVAMGSFILVLIMIFIAIRPAVSSVIKQIADNKKREELIFNQETKIAALTRLIQEEQRYNFEIELLSENYPEFENTEYLVRNLSVYEETQENLDLTSVIVDEVLVGSNIDIRTSEVTVTFYSDINEAGKLIEYLEAFPSIMDIKSISFNFSDDEDAANTANLPLQGNVVFSYYTQQVSSENSGF